MKGLRKNIFPILFVVVMFGATLVLQMLINGKDLSASKLTRGSEKFAVFESSFKSLRLETTKNSTHDLSKTESPIVILNFWASWCRPCLSEFSTLKKLVEKYPRKVLVLGINNDEEKPRLAIAKVEKDLSLNFESVIDADSEITNKFLIERIPASIAFYKGKAFHFVNEEFDFMNSEFISKIEELLSE